MTNGGRKLLGHVCAVKNGIPFAIDKENRRTKGEMVYGERMGL